MVDNISSIISIIANKVSEGVKNFEKPQSDVSLDFPEEQDEEATVVDLKPDRDNPEGSFLDKMMKQRPIIDSTFDLDSNDDGIVTPEEIESLMSSNTIAALFKDENGKLNDAMILALGIAGGISVEDLCNNLRAIDTNGDGVISEDEIEAFKNSAEYQRYQNIVENTQSAVSDVVKLTNNFFQ